MPTPRICRALLRAAWLVVVVQRENPAALYERSTAPERHMLVHGLCMPGLKSSAAPRAIWLGMARSACFMEQLSHGGGLIIEQGHAYAGRVAVLVACQGIGKGARSVSFAHLCSHVRLGCGLGT